MCLCHHNHTNTLSRHGSSKTVNCNCFLATLRKLVTSDQYRCHCRCMVHPYNKSIVKKPLCLHSSEFQTFFQSSYIPTPCLRHHTSCCHFPLVSHGYFLLSSLLRACLFAVVPSLRHLPLISGRLSSFFFICSPQYTLSTFFLWPFTSFQS